MSVPLTFEVVGEGHPVVILHGLFGSGRNWRSVAHALAPYHRVYCVDLRNHGQSPWMSTMNYAEMADDVRTLIQSERLDRPVVIGHSMGGKTAMTLALETPKAVGRLIVVDIAPVSYVDRFSVYIDAMQSIDTQSLTRRVDAMQALTNRIVDPSIAGFLMQNLVSRDEHFDWRINIAAITNAVPTLSGFPPELLSRSYGGPMTLIRGALSDYVQPSDLPAIRKLFPSMQAVAIEGAGHWVHADRPTEFLAALDLLPAVAV